MPLEGEPLPERFRGGGQSSFADTAKQEGLALGPRTHRYNSTPAHEAAIWADGLGRGDEFRKAVYGAYFAENLNIGAADVLAGIAAELGLDVDDLRAALEEGRYRGQVLTQFEHAHEIGVSAVPTFIAGGYALVGAHPLENMRKLIAAAGAEGSATR